MRRARTPMLSGWGGLQAPGREDRAEDLERASKDAVLFRGLGRSYGDSSLPPPSRPQVVATPLADRILGFDEQTGLLRAEAGLSLDTLNRLFLPRGFFTPVSPGTKYVTLGGMVASDVHGKNHHRDGTIGAHVTGLTLRVSDGRIVPCSPEREPELFWATVGGMGLTGHVLEVELRMRRIPSPWIVCASERVRDIDHFIDALKGAAPDWPFTVGWIDCLSRGRRLGRGILYRGRWAEPQEAPQKFPRPRSRFAVPFTFPNWALGRWTVRAFNELYYRAHVPRVRSGIMDPDSFFYPLDAVEHWNRIYGRRGFIQYQCVLPEAAGRSAARGFLELLTRRGGASFLCVIKDCGAQGLGLLSFPMHGISIAVDIPFRPGTQALVDALNEFVISKGGRIYLTKDALTRPEHFRAMEPRLARWQQVRRIWDPGLKVRSAQSVRLFGDPP